LDLQHHNTASPIYSDSVLPSFKRFFIGVGLDTNVVAEDLILRLVYMSMYVGMDFEEQRQ